MEAQEASAISSSILLVLRGRLLCGCQPDLPVPHEVRTFKLDPLYLSLPTDESNEAWEALSGRKYDINYRNKLTDSK
jgi:hypothetical protein